MSKKRLIITIVGWLLIFTTLFLLMCSCSPVKRLQRMQQNNPYLFKRYQDTVKIYDTTKLTILPIYADTAVNMNRLFDTVTIYKDHLKIKVWQKTDTLYIEGKTDTLVKTITKEIAVPVIKYITPPPLKKSFPWKWLFVAAIALFAIYGIYLFKK